MRTDQPFPAAEKIADTLKLPKDVLLGASVMTAIGNRELRIENCKSILEFREDYILIQGNKERILVKGKKLHMEYYTHEDMKIRGFITQIQYQ